LDECIGLLASVEMPRRIASEKPAYQY